MRIDSNKIHAMTEKELNRKTKPTLIGYVNILVEKI